MARSRIYTVQRSIYLTPEMWDTLSQLARQRGREVTEVVLIREAVSLYIDQQADVISSRRHFQKSLQDRLDGLEARLNAHGAQQFHTLRFYLHVLIHLFAYSLAYMVTVVSRKEVTAQQLVQRAVIEARRDEAILTDQIQSVHELDVPA